jgi:hypothetical protein
MSELFDNYDQDFLKSLNTTKGKLDKVKSQPTCTEDDTQRNKTRLTRRSRLN